MNEINDIIVANRQEKFVFLLSAIIWSLDAFLDFQLNRYFSIILAIFCWIVYFIKKNKGLIRLDSEGWSEDGKIKFSWNDVESLFCKGSSTLKIKMTNGNTEKINLFSVNTKSRVEIVKYLKDKIS